MIETTLWRCRVGTFLPRRWKTSRSVSTGTIILPHQLATAVLLFSLLVVCGDIESNPGPVNGPSDESEHVKILDTSDRVPNDIRKANQPTINIEASETQTKKKKTAASPAAANLTTATPAVDLTTAPVSYIPDSASGSPVSATGPLELQKMSAGGKQARKRKHNSGVELYKRLEKYIMSEEELRDNGFPRPSEDGSSQAKYYKERETKDVFLKENERICRRCGKRFYVAKDGGPISFEECVYHWGNAYKKKYAGSIVSRYVCCNERAGTKGCQVAKSHVHKHNKTENRSGYMRTMPDTDPKKNTRVLSLDCEMVYTKAGLELARVTVVDDTLSVVYETLVKPDTEVIDYNTRFSGITESDLQGVTTTLRGVQAVMLSMVSDKTILMGHSLENDLAALKMIHSTVVDTSLVFPHRLGLPYKRALRHLIAEFLQKIIQADDSGHDSKEDALACIQLMIYKVKDDAKGKIRRV